MSRPYGATLAGALIAALALAVPAHAQFDALKDKLKQKAGDAVDGNRPAGASTGSAQAAPRGPASRDSSAEDFYALTGGPLDRYIAGLRAEIAKRREIEQLRAARKTPQEYQRCMIEFYQSDEGRKASAAMSAEISKGGDAMTTATRNLQDAIAQHCGPDPNDDSLKRKEEKAITDAGTAAARMSELQMAMFHERIAPWLSGGGPAAKADPSFKVKSPYGLFYTYRADEMAALHARADVLAKLLGETP